MSMQVGETCEGAAELNWEGPYRFGKWIKRVLEYHYPEDKRKRSPWPPSRQGVYVVTKGSWKSDPFKRNTPPLYVGSGRNILQRIGQLVQDLLGFCGPSEDKGSYAGSHSGGEKLWCYGNLYDVFNKRYKLLNKRKMRTRDLYIGWAVTSEGKCHTCVERWLLKNHKGLLNKKNQPETVCCCVNNQ